MNFVRIKDKESAVKLPINNQKLKVDVVKTYFPGASGLIFFLMAMISVEYALKTMNFI